jgi:replicative DNA helicase
MRTLSLSFQRSIARLSEATDSYINDHRQREIEKDQMENNYIEINRQSWNNRVDAHLKSEFYDLDNFLKGKSSLNSIELDMLGVISGKSIPLIIVSIRR